MNVFQPTGISNQAQPNHKPLILIVDDSPEILTILQRALNRRGWDVEIAENGAIALEKVHKRQPALVLLDMRMPVMNGWEFARKLRNEYGRRIPITVMTAAEDSKLRADEVGADSYVGKPFDLTHLYEVVEDTIAE